MSIYIYLESSLVSLLNLSVFYFHNKDRILTLSNASIVFIATNIWKKIIHYILMKI